MYGIIRRHQLHIPNQYERRAINEDRIDHNQGNEETGKQEKVRGEEARKLRADGKSLKFIAEKYA